MGIHTLWHGYRYKEKETDKETKTETDKDTEKEKEKEKHTEKETGASQRPHRPLTGRRLWKKEPPISQA